MRISLFFIAFIYKVTTFKISVLILAELTMIMIRWASLMLSFIVVSRVSWIITIVVVIIFFVEFDNLSNDA